MIVCDCLHKKFGTVTAVDGVSMEIKDGTFLGLLGPNGAGKTTLMRMMTGLLTKYRRASFLIMRMSWHAGLPDLKRIQASLVELSGMPTVISEAHLEQRQRERLQQQRIPFICPGVQAYLPFMDEEYWSGKPNKHVKVYDPHEWAQLED